MRAKNARRNLRNNRPTSCTEELTDRAVSSELKLEAQLQMKIKKWSHDHENGQFHKIGYDEPINVRSKADMKPAKSTA